MAEAPKPPHHVRLAELHPADPELSDDATIDEAQLRPRWEDVSAEFVELRGSRLDQGTLAGTRWRRAAWSDVALSDVDLANAAFAESGWVRVRLERCRATGLNVAGSTLRDVEMADSRLDVGNLRYAHLTRCRFTGCHLTGTELLGADLTDVEFHDCRLDGVDFANARCARVRLSGCTLEGLRGVTGLAGATIDPLDVFDVAHQLAAALGIHLA